MSVFPWVCIHAVRQAQYSVVQFILNESKMIIDGPSIAPLHFGQSQRSRTPNFKMVFGGNSAAWSDLRERTVPLENEIPL